LPALPPVPVELPPVELPPVPVELPPVELPPVPVELPPVPPEPEGHVVVSELETLFEPQAAKAANASRRPVD
jgi:hypothetical protein